MTHSQLERRVRLLGVYAAAATILFLALVLSAFSYAQKRRFGEIDAERINVVGSDGKLAVVIANHERLPGNIMNGTESGSRPGVGGLLFYNSEGDEAGGLIFSSKRRPDGSFGEAFDSFTLDRFEGDQVVALQYTESADQWSAGLNVSHMPRHGIAEWIPARDSVDRLPEAERAGALRALRRRFYEEGKWEVKRVWVGERGRTASVDLNDTRGRPRIRMVVDSLDVARLEFLDKEGRVVERLPRR